MKFKLLYTSKFIKQSTKLPQNQQEKLARLLFLMAEKPFHPELHTKPLAGILSGYYSFRITRDWRVIFSFSNPDEIKLLRLSHRKDIYR